MTILFGYIDPGTGAIIIQVIAAGVLGLGVFFRRVVFSPFRYVAKMFQRDSQVDEEATE